MVFLLSVSFVSALDLDIESITLNNRHELDLEGDTNLVRVERGERVDIEVCYTSYSDIEDLEMDVFMRGYEYDVISDSSRPFDVYANETDCADFTFDVPKEMYDQKFNIWFTATTAYDELRSINFPVRIRGQRHNIVFDDVSFSPRGRVEAGSAIYATARLLNLGERSHDDVKVDLSIPELGLSDSYYMDFDRGESFEPNERETTGELYLRVPRNVEDGEYDLEMKLTYNRGNDYDLWTSSIEIVDGEVVDEPVSEKTEITLDTDRKSTYVDEKTSFPITIENRGSEKATYELSSHVISGWGETSIEPESYFALNPGESRVVYVNAEANKEGEHNLLFSVDVNDGEFKRDVSLTVDAEKEKVVDEKEPSWDNIRRGLEIGLIVLIGLLVILALVIAFSGKKPKKEGKEESDDESETYY